jgi:hypothetical protein
MKTSPAVRTRSVQTTTSAFGPHHVGRRWEDAEADLQAGWERYPHRGENPTAWDEIKAAVKDAWDRVVGTSSARSEERSPKPRE